MSLNRFKEIADKYLTACCQEIINREPALLAWRNFVTKADDLERAKISMIAKDASLVWVYHIKDLANSWNIVKDAIDITFPVTELLKLYKQNAQEYPSPTIFYQYSIYVSNAIEHFLQAVIAKNLLNDALKGQVETTIAEVKQNVKAKEEASGRSYYFPVMITQTEDESVNDKSLRK